MTESVALVGSGLIGRGWMMLFGNAGCDVRVYDSDPNAATPARAAVADNLRVLEAEGMIDSAVAIEQRIRYCSTMAEAVEGATYVQESVFESRDVKAGVFNALGKITGPEVILASSASAIAPEDFFVDVSHRERCIIAHPFSPPHLIPLVEIVVTRWTSPAVLEATWQRMKALGQTPVKVHKPVFGFVVNRLQAVVIDEAMALVKEGVIDPEDLDLCMSHGLGLRWTFMGPFETMDLNAAQGIKDYVGKYGELYQKMLAEIRPRREWLGPAIDKVSAWRRSKYPGEADVARRRLWRDQNLMKLAKLFRGGRLGGAAK
jgi:L-gulonate 3-dehydrogenase